VNARRTSITTTTPSASWQSASEALRISKADLVLCLVYVNGLGRLSSRDSNKIMRLRKVTGKTLQYPIRPVASVGALLALSSGPV
jgi:hypothetical protein